MNQTAIFWPMMGHVVLVVVLYAMLGLRRKEAVQTGSAKISQFRENQIEPSQSLFVRNAIANQFELPVLFHVVCLGLYATGGAGLAAVVLAWVFTLSRYVHSFIHVTSNRIRFRQPAFMIGFAVVVVMWVLLAVHLLSA